MDLAQAARALGVHYQTAYRWVRSGRLAAVKVGGTYRVADDDVERLAEELAATSAPPQQVAVRRWEQLHERVTTDLLAGDEPAVRSQVDRLSAGGVDPVRIMEELLAPAMRCIGDMWAAGTTSVAEEHRATAICERAVARLSVHRRGRPRGVCVAATPPGERHALPSAMAAVALRNDRWQVHHLGADVPAADLARLAAAVGTGLVVLSATMPGSVEAACAMGETLAPARVLVGRPGARLSELVEMARLRR